MLAHGSSSRLTSAGGISNAPNGLSLAIVSISSVVKTNCRLEFFNPFVTHLLLTKVFHRIEATLLFATTPTLSQSSQPNCLGLELR